MSWEEVRKGFPPRVLEECRAGIVVGHRLPISDDPAAILAQQRRGDGLEVWIVDDLQAPSGRGAVLVGLPILQAFGLDGDHRAGVEPAELVARSREAAAKVGGTPSIYFAWSGPLCGGYLVKGRWTDEFPDEDLWFESEAECPVYEASRGARQDPAPGGVRGAALFMTDYDSDKEPPVLDAAFLASKDAALARAGLLDGARIYVLPHYD